MTNLKSHLQINPIIVKELRSRMRGGRAFITLTITLLLTAGLMYALLQVMLSVSQYSYDVVSPRIGQALFTVLAYLELAVICAITPAVTAGAISGEREKQTYEMLQATPLSPSSILWGKLFSALSYVFLLLFAAVPLASLIFIFGGVSPSDMFKALLVLLALAVAFGVLGLFMSALFVRTGRATVASFMVVLVLNFVPLVVAAVLAITRQGDMPRGVLAFSPISILAGVLAPFNSTYGGGVLDILPIISGYAFRSAVTPVSMTSIPRPIYHYGLAFYAVLTLVLYLVSARLVRPARRWKFTRAEIVRGAAIGVIIAGLLAAAFFSSAPRYEWNRAPVVDTPAPFMGGGGGMAEPAVPVSPQTADDVMVNGPASALSLEVRAGVYAAVIRQLIMADHNAPAEGPPFTTAYILSQMDDRAGDPMLADVVPEGMDADLQQAILSQLEGVDIPVEWVASVDDLPRQEKSSNIEPGTMLVTVGVIYERADGTLLVSGSVHLTGEMASGRRYVLSPDENGKWAVLSTTGMEWMN
jgi:ABC-type transport system involved in multi-copper enzyme maturation permease subunit